MKDKKKTLTERMLEETLSDNSQVEHCKQCKDCIFRDDGTEGSHYTKSSCQIFKYPNMKPLNVINNRGKCEIYHNENEEDNDEE